MPANAAAEEIAEDVSATKVAAFEDSVVVCDEKTRKMEKLEEEKQRRNEKLERLCRLRDRLKDLEKRLEDGAISSEEFHVEARKATTEAEAEERRKEQQEEKLKCRNCDREFSLDHQCYL